MEQNEFKELVESKGFEYCEEYTAVKKFTVLDDIVVTVKVICDYAATQDSGSPDEIWVDAEGYDMLDLYDSGYFEKLTMTPEEMLDFALKVTEENRIEIPKKIGYIRNGGWPNPLNVPAKIAGPGELLRSEIEDDDPNNIPDTPPTEKELRFCAEMNKWIGYKDCINLFNGKCNGGACPSDEDADEE